APEASGPPEIPALPDPATVLAPERAPYHLSLGEAFALALEHGTVGVQSSRAPGLAIESALARFDPFWSTGMSWVGTDQPTQGLASLSNGLSANFISTLAKPLSTGGTAGVSFSTGYTLYSNPPVGQFGVLNPSYTPQVLVGFEQPLLRFYGVDINQLLPGFAGSSLFPTLNSRPAS